MIDRENYKDYIMLPDAIIIPTVDEIERRVILKRKQRKSYLVIVVIILIMIIGSNGVVYAATGESWLGRVFSRTNAIAQSGDLEEVFCLKNCIFSKDWIISENGMLMITDIPSGTIIPLCETMNCKHNNLDECMAYLPMDCNVTILNVYNNQIYAFGNTNDEIQVFRLDMNGANHEKIAQYLFDDSTRIRGIEHYYNADEHKSYFFARFEENVMLDEIGEIEESERVDTNDSLIAMQLISYYYDQNSFEKEADFPLSAYQLQVRFREQKESELYMDVSWQDEPYREKMASEKYFHEHEELEVWKYNVGNREWSECENYRYNDYIGSLNNTSYYAEELDRNTYSGKVRVEKGGDINYIEIQDLQGVNKFEAQMKVLENQIIMNYCNKNGMKDEMRFYSFEGKLKEKVKICGEWIVGENADYYIMGNSIYTDSYPISIIRKDRIHNTQKYEQMICEMEYK